MTFKMSEQAQTIKIFNLRSDTNEFIGAGDAYIPPHTGLPANCTDIALLIFPPVILLYLTLKPRHGVCMRITAARWFTTQQPAIRFISPLWSVARKCHISFTGGEYQKWDGKAKVWVKDEAAEKQRSFVRRKKPKAVFANGI